MWLIRKTHVHYVHNTTTHLPGVVALSETLELKLFFKIGTLISHRLG